MVEVYQYQGQNEFSPDRYTVGLPVIRDGLKDMQKIFELEAEKSALLSAGEALLEWARRDLMWKPIETAPRGQWLITYRTGDKRATMAQLGFGDEWISPSGHTTVTSHTYLPPTHWCPLPSPQTNKLPKPLEAFAEALKRVRGE